MIKARAYHWNIFFNVPMKIIYLDSDIVLLMNKY